MIEVPMVVAPLIGPVCEGVLPGQLLPPGAAWWGLIGLGSALGAAAAPILGRHLRARWQRRIPRPPTGAPRPAAGLG